MFPVNLLVVHAGAVQQQTAE